MMLTANRSGLLLPAMLLLAACAQPTPEPAAPDPRWSRDAHGLQWAPTQGDFRTVRLQVHAEDIIRVSASPGTDFTNLPPPLMVVAEPVAIPFKLAQDGDRLRLATSRLVAEASLATGTVRFLTPDGRELLTEAGRSLAPVDADPGVVDADSFAIRQMFRRAPDEGFYGLGQRQDGRVNIAGENIELTTHNIEIAIPFLVSSKGYGLLWNNAAISRVGQPGPPMPLAEGFELYDAAGQAGGLTVRYFDGEKLLLERQAADLDYQYLAHANTREHPLPEETADAQDLRIEWEGDIVPKLSGAHELKMYSSGYAQLSLDGKPLLQRWRMNWNPWFHNARVDLQAGQHYRLRFDWRPQGGYFRLLYHPPATPELQDNLSITAETGKAVDYYFVSSSSADQAIAGYRRLTGQASMLPKSAFGFWQSRERYKSQDELLGVLREYRERNIPIDNIVLDWSYWPVDAWGSHDFDPQFFPDPKGLVDAVHELDARIMISVWPKFYPTTAHYQELNAKGCMFNKNIEEANFDWISPGYLNAFYDPFAPACRDIYWRQVRDSINVHGFDAWWMDAVEPDMHSNLSVTHRKDLMTPNALGTGAEVFNAYALPHNEAVYRGDRDADPEQRPFILTRSGFGGIQRTGSAIWSGDIVSRWSNMKEQIAAGIGAGLAGMPYWTFDIGGFTPEDHYRWTPQGPVGHYSQMPLEHQGEWQELNLRWFQFGAFAPLFRSHGQNPYREVFNLADEGSEVYASLVDHIELRYRLLPYIYTLAADAHHKHGTLMRGLVMDFPQDEVARNVTDQYLFGPAILVNPVYEFGARNRPVYLPVGADWIDFHSGARHAGGQTITANAPLSQMPLFVRAGSILPMGPVIQHSGAGLNAPLEINVYTGADGSFELYEDDGVSHAFETGGWSRIPLHYDEVAGTLTIGERVGSFEGMAAEREISVRWISGAGDDGVATTPALRYSGAAISLQRP